MPTKPNPKCRSWNTWSKKLPNLRSFRSCQFWMEPTFPQYRKIVNGKEKLLDGTETKDTEIVKYDYSEPDNKWRALLLKEAMKKLK